MLAAAAPPPRCVDEGSRRARRRLGLRRENSADIRSFSLPFRAVGGSMIEVIANDRLGRKGVYSGGLCVLQREVID